MKIPQKQSDKYNLVGKDIEWIEDGVKIAEGKISGFFRDKVIIVTIENVEGIEIDPHKVISVSSHAE